MEGGGVSDVPISQENLLLLDLERRYVTFSGYETLLRNERIPVLLALKLKKLTAETSLTIQFFLVE